MNVYYLKQKISFKDKYLVYDINEEPVLQVIGDSNTVTLDRIFGNIFSIGHTLHINNLKGKTELRLKRKLGVIWKKYDVINESNTTIAFIKQNKNLLIPKMYISSKYGDYLINGDVLGKNFTIIKDKVTVAKISKKLLSFGDTYKICVYENDTDKIIIAAVIAMDNCYHN
jgi:uncharacterized protein YxjI